MMDYKDLCARLRSRAWEHRMHRQLRAEAADAIEALQVKIREAALRELSSEGQWVEHTEALAKDAARWRFLMEHCEWEIYGHRGYLQGADGKTKYYDSGFDMERIEPAIDAAMAAK